MKKRDLRQVGIYLDKKGRSILYNAKKKEGYIIPDKEVNRVATLQYRVWLSVSMGVVLYFLFNLDWWVVLLATAALVVGLELIYRKSMLATYSVITNYTPANVLDKSIDVYKQNPRSILSRVALYALLGVLMVMTIWGKPLDTAETQIVMVVSAFAFLNSAYHLMVFFKTKK